MTSQRLIAMCLGVLALGLGPAAAEAPPAAGQDIVVGRPPDATYPVQPHLSDDAQRAALQALRALYAAHADAPEGADPVWMGDETLRWFAPDLATVMREQGVGFDPLYNAQDHQITGLTIVPTDSYRGYGAAEFVVDFNNFDQPTSVIVAMDPVGPGGRWVLSDALYHGQFTLRQILGLPTGPR